MTEASRSVAIAAGSVSGLAMRILHICPLWFRIAPDAPGGIESLLPGLFRALREADCENTVLAVRGSAVDAEVIPVVDEPMYEQTASGAAWEYGPFEQHQLLTALRAAPEFDVVHSHVGWSGWWLAGVPGLGERVLHTQHNPVSPDMAWFIARHPELRLTTVSEHQAERLRRAGAKRCHVVRNGLDFDRFPLRGEGKRGLVYLGRVEREKGTDLAVRVARQLRMPLAIAGPMVDHEFFAAEIAPQLDDQVRYVGVVRGADKADLLGGAACAMMPSRDEEGFGLVALEAMACGTPVAALARGALREVVEPGVTGFLAKDEEQLAAAVQAAVALDPATIRARAERRFDVAASAAGYLALYREIAAASAPRA
jgi:glycosyltransferase involved in cell wall biosynthesis